MPFEGLEVEDLSASWGDVPVLDRISFSIPRGKTAVLLGPNGAGKSTLLRCLVGLQPTTGGQVRLDGRDLREVPAHRREIGLVPQEASLFSHRTVAENIAFGPALRKAPPDAVDQEVRRLAARLGVADLLARFPSQLSGGEAQRVALARALAATPRALLLDEPFANLDPEFRMELRAEFRSVFQSLEVPVLHVTHDRDEGLFLADRVLLLFDGTVHQQGSPAEILSHPLTARIARFLGYNVLPTNDGEVAVRPEEVAVEEAGDGFRATVLAAGTVGRGQSIHLRLEDGTRVEALLPPTSGPLAPGREVRVQWRSSIPIGRPHPGRPPHPEEDALGARVK